VTSSIFIQKLSLSRDRIQTLTLWTFVVMVTNDVTHVICLPDTAATQNAATSDTE